MSVQLFIRDIQFMSQVEMTIDTQLDLTQLHVTETFQYLGHYVLEWPRLPVLEKKEKVGKVESSSVKFVRLQIVTFLFSGPPQSWRAREDFGNQ